MFFFIAKSPFFSNLYDRATPDLVAKALRQHQRDKALAQSQSDRAQNVAASNQPNQEAQLMQMMGEQQNAQNQEMRQEKDVQHANEIEKIALKEAAKTERDMLKNRQ